MQTEKPLEVTPTPKPPASEEDLKAEVAHLSDDQLVARIKMYEKNLSAMNVEQKSINNKIAEQNRKIEGNKKRVYIKLNIPI